MMASGFRRALAGACLLMLPWPAAALAEDMPSFSVELKDGTMSPARIEVPANTRFRIDIRNTGTTPAEFESTQLHKEKVLPAGGTSSLVFVRLAPGEYVVFDDFHPQAKGTLVAK